MERWQTRVAVITGASSGIGQVIAKDLVEAGLRVVALGRRLERLEQNRSEIPKDLQKNYYVRQCDVSKEEDVIATFNWIEKTVGGTDILVNNAGVVKFGDLVELDSAILHQVIDTNVKGVVFCTKEAFKSMQSRNFDGHIIHINSVAGHGVPNQPVGAPGANIYYGSKHAVTAINEVVRNELRNKGTKIKTTSVSPGAVRTEIIPKEYYELMPALLNSEDISQAVLFAISTPPHVQIHEIIIKPIGEPF